MDDEEVHQGEVGNSREKGVKSRVIDASVAKRKDSSSRSETTISRSDRNKRLKFSSRAFSTPVSCPRVNGDGKNQQQSITSDQIMTMMMMQQQEDRQIRQEEMKKQQQVQQQEERDMRREEMRLQMQLPQKQQSFMNIMMMNMFRPKVDKSEQKQYEDEME